MPPATEPSTSGAAQQPPARCPSCGAQTVVFRHFRGAPVRAPGASRGAPLLGEGRSSVPGGRRPVRTRKGASTMKLTATDLDVRARLAASQAGFRRGASLLEGASNAQVR